MIRHPDPEIQFLVETLETQRDEAVAQAAALFRQVQDLQQQLAELQQAPVDQNITES